ncbi:4-hydroxy-L-threonine phosphate dehydrogenase PdxA [Bradyrhizobium sp. LM6.11]
MTAKPLIALAMGDPAGISPELTAKLVVQDDIRACSRIVVIGDRRIFDQGARIAGVKPELKTMERGADFRAAEGETLFVDLGHLDPSDVQRGVASLAGGRFALANYKHALELGRDNRVDAVCFTPFNKQAMRLARAEYDDEDRVLCGSGRTQDPRKRIQCAGPALERTRDVPHPPQGRCRATVQRTDPSRAQAD